MRIGDTLKRAAGLFVELPESEPEPETGLGDLPDLSAPLMPSSAPTPVTAPGPTAKTVEQIVRESPGPNLDEIKVPAAPQESPIAPDGTVSFPAIYAMANLPSSPFTAEQVLELLASLPAELPMETKRATLKVTLSAMAKTLGVSPETVVADASRKLAALAAYAQSYTDQANGYVTKAELEIAALQQEIESRRQGIESATAKQAQMVQACSVESDRLDDVLEFFSLDVPPSKLAGQP
jgi:hypothetical protein